MNVSLQGFSAKNVSMGNGASLIIMSDQEDIHEYPTRVDIQDVTLEDIVEIEDEETGGEDELTIGGGGLVFAISGPGDLTMRNLTARNIQFKSI